MHDSVMTWVTERVETYELADAPSVLECGAKYVNGSVRPLFTGHYWGIDIQPQEGYVDQVVSANRLPMGDGSYDVVVSTEMLEHDPYPWRSIGEMARVLRPGGHLLVTTRGFMFGRHDHPSDYYRFSQESLGLLVTDTGLKIEQLMDDPDPHSPGVFVHAIK